MADNVAITEGSGKSVATDDVGGQQYQRMKLDLGTDGAAAPALAGAGAVATGVQRVTLASDDPAVAKLGTIDTDTGNIAISLAIMDDWDDTDKCKVIIQTGSNAIGKLAANTGVDIGDVDVTSIIPLTGAINLGKARDSILGASDVGVMALAVRDDTLTTLTPADGDYVPLRVSSTGQLHVTGAGGGTEYTEDVITAAPQIGSAIMMERDDIITTVTPVEADWIGLRGSAEGALWVQDFNSDAILADTANMDTNLGIIAGAVAAGQMQVDVVAPLPAGTNNIGDVDVLTVPAPLNLTGGGVEASALRVTIANDSTGVLSIDDNGGSITVDGAITANAGTNLNTSALALEGGGNLATIAGDTTAIQAAVEIIDDWDATHASPVATDGPQIMGAGYSTGLPADIGADADAARICTDRFGRIVRGLMPQWFNAVFDSANASAEGNAVKAATVSRKIYILSLTISVDTEMWVKLQDEDSNAITPKFWLKAGGGLTKTYPPEAPLVLNVVNKALEVITEGAGDIGVEITGYLAV